MNKLGIYVHIPFCIQKCRYCDFYSLAGTSKEIYYKYRDALIRHFQWMAPKAKGYTVDTIYFGGGTPSLLPPGVIANILASLRDCFEICADAEITLECNPKTADQKAMEIYSRIGINRLSIGCQSANDLELKMLGRLHTFSDFCETVEMARKAGIHNISADLMMGLPDQTLCSLTDSIEKIAQTDVSHISVYGLKIESGTWFARHLDQLNLPDEALESEMYLHTVSKLAQLGYAQYEISNFAKENCMSRHNLKYWHAKPYLGFGPGAYTYFENKRYGYKRDLGDYILSNYESDFAALLLDEEEVSIQEATEEKLLLGLRLNKGILLSDYCFDGDIHSFCRDLESKGLVTFQADTLALTAKGMLVDNYITTELLLKLK